MSHTSTKSNKNTWNFQTCQRSTHGKKYITCDRQMTSCENNIYIWITCGTSHPTSHRRCRVWNNKSPLDDLRNVMKLKTRLFFFVGGVLGKKWRRVKLLFSHVKLHSNENRSQINSWVSVSCTSQTVNSIQVHIVFKSTSKAS